MNVRISWIDRIFWKRRHFVATSWMSPLFLEETAFCGHFLDVAAFSGIDDILSPILDVTKILGNIL
jgi:hypothetical protein